MAAISPPLVRRFIQSRLQVVWCAVLCTTALGQNSTQPQSIANGSSTTDSPPPAFVAEPKSQRANPFLPLSERSVRLPVAVDGYCVVTLRERQEWLRGSEANQRVFDGKLYWFRGQRERVMFATRPRRYVPALNGDCVVTLAEHEIRQRGIPQHGTLHDGRLFFFRSLAEQQKFQANPDRYTQMDLANDGHCLVSQIDAQRKLPGLPETTVIADGLRYRFAGVHQQRKFLANMLAYGVKVPDSPQLEETQPRPSNSAPALLTPDASFTMGAAIKTKVPKETSSAPVTNKAMGGYCPVSIRDAGTWTAGDPRYRFDFDGLTYLLAGEAEQKLFAQNPSDYVPALGGNCVVTELDENRRIPGSIYHASQFEGRLFLFAGAEQKRVFDTTTPEKYANADLVAAGNCIVSLVDESRTVRGLPELLIWHRGKRYFFASTQQQAVFRENVQRYQDR